jgi:hypothetical protein
MSDEIWKNRTGKDRYEPKHKVLNRRNGRIIKLFDANNLPVRLIGDPNKPAIIYKEQVCLSAFAHNFELHFTDSPTDGNIIHTIKLLHKVETSRDELLNIISRYPQKTIYNIKVKGMDLYLAGYNFLHPEKKEGKYPVFARHNYKVYFQKNYVEELVQHFTDDGYELEVVDPTELNHDL